MAKSKFSIGDSVYLKSGGPKMTVTNLAEKSTGRITVYTQWFVGQKANAMNAHEDSFTTEDPNPQKEISEKK
ncbi:DUF2158 domain-containing protein [Acinetobacter parvus]|uniref:DUF2158 domain-containing protein n=1 Tax=Acinetobacter parvus NIPH 1103 TaxID=1217671 RepID=N8RHH5_9GAMM|nr:DUF2158 domain-containing protein [Acinetobacter parvus]ENU34863.1 hypothetical protein F989_00096 [Acinetobacter parvus NIPH 1103]